jgi:hypothetical protein
VSRIRGIFDAPGDSIENVVLLDRTYLETATAQVGCHPVLSAGRPEEHVTVYPTNRFHVRQLSGSDQERPEKSFIASQITDFRDMVKFVQLVGYTALMLPPRCEQRLDERAERLREMAILADGIHQRHGVQIVL